MNKPSYFQEMQINLEGVRTVSRLDACQEQIDVAIELFFKGQFLASITLAAAAERVLSDLLPNGSQPATSAELESYFAQILQKHGQAKDFYKWRNEVYDWLRHADRQPDATAEISPYEALMWIMISTILFLKMNGCRTEFIERFHQYWAETITTVMPHQ